MRMRPDVPAACRRLCAAVVTALSAACTTGKAPAPGDPLAADDPPPPPQTLSRFSVPLDYDFTPVMATVERVVPRTFGSLREEHKEDDSRRSYAYEATRGPFTAFVSGSNVHLRTTLSYAARGGYKPLLGPTIRAGCGSETNLAERPRIIVELITPLTIDTGWNLRSKARLGRVAVASDTKRDQCQVSIIRIDVTDKVIAAARKALTSQLPEIDRRIARVSLDSLASGWWMALNRPIRLRNDLWLLLKPARLRLGTITGTRRVLTIQAGVDAYPRIITGAEPAVVMSPLPALAGSPGTDGFNIVLDGNIDYPTISRTLTSLLRGKSVGVKGRSVSIDSVNASGRAGGKIELAIRFSGDATGIMQLNGTPAYSARLGQITVPDLDYDLDTDNNMVDAVAWAKSDDLRTMLRDKATIPVAPVLARGREILTTGLNRTMGSALTMTATVDSVAVHDLYVRRPGIIVRASAMGTAKVAVRQVPKKK